MFSLAQTKLPSYVTPAYPALALLTAGCVERLRNRTSEVKVIWLKAAAISLAAVGAIGTVTVFCAARIYLPGEERLAVIGLVPLLIGVVAWSFVKRNLPQRFACSIMVSAIAMMLFVFGYASPRISERQQIVEFLNAAQSGTAPTRLASFAVHEPSWVFYANQKVPFLTSDRESEAIEFLQHRNATVITTRSEFERIREQLPTGAAMIAESGYFLKNERLVLIGRPMHFADLPSTANRSFK